VGEMAGGGVIAIEAAAVGADPDMVIFVQQDRIYVVVTQAEGIGRVVFEMFVGSLARVEDGNAVGPGAGPYIPLVILCHAEDVVATDSVGVSFFVPEVGEGLCGGIEEVESSAVGADPKFFIWSLDDTEYVVVAEAVGSGGMSVMGEASGIRFKDVHSTGEGAQPHITGFIAVGGVDGIIAEAGEVDIVVFVMGEFFRLRVADIQSPVLESHPDILLIVFADGIDDIPSQLVTAVGGMFEMAKEPGVARVIHSVESSAVGADPETVPAVLEDGVDLVIAE